MKNSLKNKLNIFILDEVIKKGIFRFLPDKQFMVFDYFFTHKKMPKLQNPKTFSEKLQWIKLYGGLEKYTKYVDKLEVRDFISKTIGKEHLVPLIGVWEKFEDMPFDKLPHQFVLKATHGSAYIFVCKNKSSLDINSLKKTVTKWIQEDFYNKTREIQYKFCKPKIICEEYLEDEFGELTDYKIFCSNGKPYIVEVIWDRFTDNRGDVYKDLNWKTLDIAYIGHPYSKKILKKPSNLKEMLEISKKLSKIFPFVRVDMYSIKNKIYVGELTLTPANGLERFDPPEVDYQLGELIDLSKYNKDQNIKYNKLVITSPEIQAKPIPNKPLDISK